MGIISLLFLVIVGAGVIKGIYMANLKQRDPARWAQIVAADEEVKAARLARQGKALGVGIDLIRRLRG